MNIHPVRYTQKQTGIEIAANVYTPAGYDPAKKYPAIVVAHPNGGVKEQVAGLYAQQLAEKGYITIAFDAAYQGASGGEPRYTDKPQNRIEDALPPITSANIRARTANIWACLAFVAAVVIP